MVWSGSEGRGKGFKLKDGRCRSEMRGRPLLGGSEAMALLPTAVGALVLEVPRLWVGPGQPDVVACNPACGKGLERGDS